MAEYLITLGDGLYYGVTAMASVVGEALWALFILAVWPLWLIDTMGGEGPHHLYQEIVQSAYLPAKLLLAFASFACCRRKGYAGGWGCIAFVYEPAFVLFCCLKPKAGRGKWLCWWEIPILAYALALCCLLYPKLMPLICQVFV